MAIHQGSGPLRSGPIGPGSGLSFMPRSKTKIETKTKGLYS